MVTGVIGLLILFLQPEGFFFRSYNRVLTFGTNGMEDMANRLATSRYDVPSSEQYFGAGDYGEEGDMGGNGEYGEYGGYADGGG